MQQYVQHPERPRTRIRIGGAVFRRFTNRASGRYWYDEESNSLRLNYAVEILELLDPSDPTQRIPRSHQEVIRTQAQHEAMVSVLEGDGIPEGGRLFTDPFYDAHAALIRVTYPEGDTVTIDLYDPSGMERTSLENGLMQIGSAANLAIPFTNVDQNDGDDNMCVERWLGPAFVAPAEGWLSVHSIIQRANVLRRSVEILDVYGKVFTYMHHGTERKLAATDVVMETPTIKPARAVLYRGHVYPIDRAHKLPHLLREPIHKYTLGQDSHIIDLFNEKEAAFFKQNGSYYVAGEGVFKPVRDTEDWMFDYVATVPIDPSHTWSVDVLREFKLAAMPMYSFMSEMLDPDLDTTEFYTMDMKKCYYYTATQLCSLQGSRLPMRVPVPDMFVTAEECDSERWREMEQKGITQPSWYVQVPHMLHRFMHKSLGISCPIVSLPVFNLIQQLYDIGLCTPVRYWPFRGMKYPWSRELEDMVPERQKGFATVVGIMGRINNSTNWQLQLEAKYEEERSHYHREWGMGGMNGGEVIARVRDTPILLNRFHYALAVIMGANELLLQDLVSLRAFDFPPPVKIVTDSLTFRLSELAYGFREVIDEFFSERYKEELPKPAVRSENAWRDPEEDRTYHDILDEYYTRNLTYTGPPGCGKTHAALQLSFDFKATSWNRNAVRIGGTTLHKLFNATPGHEARLIEQHHLLEKFRSKRILIDEAQSVSRQFWAVFSHLFHEYGTNFVFCLDIDQLPPVGGDELPIKHIPFMGRVVNMVIEHRNAPDLVAARKEVLDGTFIPEALLGGIVDPYNYTRINICTHRLTRSYINDRIAELEKAEFGKSGLYIVDFQKTKGGNEPAACKLARKGYELMRGQLLKIEPDRPMVFIDRESGKEYDLRNWPEKFNIKDVIAWGYCMTTHSTIGTTIDEPMTIWDWDADFTDFTHGLRYTALTRGKRLSDITFRREPPMCRAARLGERAQNNAASRGASIVTAHRGGVNRT